MCTQAHVISDHFNPKKNIIKLNINPQKYFQLHSDCVDYPKLNLFPTHFSLLRDDGSFCVCLQLVQRLTKKKCRRQEKKLCMLWHV